MHLMKIQLKPSQHHPDGTVLTVEYADRDTAEAQLRFMQRTRKAGWWGPTIYVEDTDGGKWCLSPKDIVWPPVLEPSAEAAAS